MKIDKTIKEYLEKYGDESMVSLSWSVYWRMTILVIVIVFALDFISKIIN